MTSTSHLLNWDQKVPPRKGFKNRIYGNGWNVFLDILVGLTWYICHKSEIYLLDICNIFVFQVPVDTLNGLLGDKEALRKVLLRHVIPGRWVTFQYSSNTVVIRAVVMVILMQKESRKVESRKVGKCESGKIGKCESVKVWKWKSRKVGK